MNEARPHQSAFEIRWDDMDSNGHLNNKQYQTYLEEARWLAVRSVGVDFRDLAARSCGPVILKAAFEYLGEVVYPDRLLIDSWIEPLGKSRADFLHAVRRASDGKPVCRARIHWLFMELKRKRPLPMNQFIANLPVADTA